MVTMVMMMQFREPRAELNNQNKSKRQGARLLSDFQQELISLRSKTLILLDFVLSTHFLKRETPVSALQSLSPGSMCHRWKHWCS